MANYQSRYTGEQIDDDIAKANAANSHFPMYEHNITSHINMVSVKFRAAFSFISTTSDKFTSLQQCAEYLCRLNNSTRLPATGIMINEGSDGRFSVFIISDIDFNFTDDTLEISVNTINMVYNESGELIDSSFTSITSPTDNPIVDTVRQIY